MARSRTVAACLASALSLGAALTAQDDALYPRGIDRQIKASIDRGLKYLQRTQATDGSFPAPSYSNAHCPAPLSQ